MELMTKLNDIEGRLSQLETLKNEIEGRLSQLETRRYQTTVRDAMRCLEHWICFEAVGHNKTQFRKFFCFNNFNNDAIKKASLATLLSSKGLTQDHLDIIDYLKDCGDICPYQRSDQTKVEWKKSIIDDDDDDDEAKIKFQLLDALETYCPFPNDPTAVWHLVGPIEKPRAKSIFHGKGIV